MTEEQPRRSKTPSAPEAPQGYRSTRRGSKAAKVAKRVETQHRLLSGLDRTGRSLRNVLWLLVWGIAIAGFTVLVLLLVATGVNSLVRWNAQRLAEAGQADAEQSRRARENVLVVGVEDGKAAGFLAMRIDQKGGAVYGIALPEGVFIDVPGQGFQRLGDSWPAGPEVSTAAISNYLGVPFESWVAVPMSAYRDALKRQDTSRLLEAASDTDLNAADLTALTRQLARIEQKDVALVPMPVKPIKLGDQTYFEPQRAEIADLLKTWWGVDAEAEAGATRVIVYNGAGVPGIAGEAAQQLIRAGLRVMDTKNADRFDYKNTIVLVRRGDRATGEEVRKVLGVGEIRVETTDEDVADVIVIIGKDYRPPKADAKEGD